MSSVVRKCLTQDGQAVIIAADLTDIVRESMKRVEAWPPAMYHLGQAFVAAALLQGLPDRNDDEKLELQWTVPAGPFGSLFVECRERSKLRGTILEPRPDVQQLKVSLGEGLFQVRRLKVGSQMPLSTGIIPSTGDVVQDVLAYLEKSEQKTCALSMWIDIGWAEQSDQETTPFFVKAAFGFLVHVLPQESLEKTQSVLWNWDRHILDLGPISKWVIKNDPVSDILAFVSAEFDPKVTFERKLEFSCTCNEDRAARALALIDAEDTKYPHQAGYKPQEGDLHFVKCEFCGQSYQLKSHVSSGSQK